MNEYEIPIDEYALWEYYEEEEDWWELQDYMAELEANEDTDL